jgi:hypothetical protein
MREHQAGNQEWTEDFHGVSGSARVFNAMDDRRIVKAQTPEKRVTSRRSLPDIAAREGSGSAERASAETLAERFQACCVQPQHDEACAKASVFK